MRSGPRTSTCGRSKRLASQTGDQMASLGNSTLICEILRRSKIIGQLIQMYRRRKQKHQINCGDENGLYPAPASGAYRLFMSFEDATPENGILSHYTIMTWR